MQPEWDAYKAEDNIAKHGVSFEEAATVFDDPFALTGPDELHSYEEDRLITLGLSAHGRYLMVVHTMTGEIVRIISARPMTRRERQQYEEGE